jgi:hypothetical protein
MVGKPAELNAFKVKTTPDQEGISWAKPNG